MNNTYLKVLAMLVRAGVVWLAGALLSHLSPKAYDLANGIITEVGGTEAIVGAIVAFVGALGWGLWVKLKSHVELKTALDLTPGATIEEVKKAAPNPLTALTEPQLK